MTTSNMAPPPQGEGRGPAIKVLTKAPWVAVPRHIFTDLRLKPTARLLLLYLLSLAQIPGWQIHLYSHVLPTLGVLEGSWPGIRKNLGRCGYYRQRKRRSADGRLWIEHLITDQPGVFLRWTRATMGRCIFRSREASVPVDGKPAFRLMGSQRSG